MASRITRRLDIRGRILVARALALFAPREVQDEIAIGGHRFWMCLQPRDPVQLHLHYAGIWEPCETWIFRAVVPPGATVLDIGANVGYFTLLAGGLVGPGGRVYSFEPVAEVYDRLQRNVQLNTMQHVHTYNVGLASEPGSRRIFFSPRADSGSTSLAPYSVDAGNSVVQMTTIDRFIGRAGIERVDLVKVDVEGAEPLVLAGASGLLRKPHPPDWIVEVNRERLAGLGFTAQDVLSTFRSADFMLFRVGQQPGELLPISETIPHDPLYTVFATKRAASQRAIRAG